MSPGDLLPGPRVLLGPGPSMADPRVLRAMSTPLLGQFDPEFTEIMNEVMDLSRFAFQTSNTRAFPVPGTGRAGLEAALTSLIEPGDRVVVAESGRFGLLLIEIAERCGAEVVPVRSEWGRLIDLDAIEAALKAARTKLVAVVHGETSTGILQPLADVARPEAAIRGRRSKVRSNYLDLGQLADYWSPARFNHHTAPTAMVYGLREALRAVHEEGLAARFARHRLHGDALRAGLDALGLTLFGKEPRAHRQFVLVCLAALEHALRLEGHRAPAGAGLDAALAHYAAGGAGTRDTGDNLGASGIGRV